MLGLLLRRRFHMSVTNNRWMNFGDVDVNVWSVAGVESTVVLRTHGQNICFDCGVASHVAARCPHVFITHGHVDHVGALHQLVARRNLCNAPRPDIFLPTSLVPHFDTICGGFSALQGEDVARKFTCEVKGFAPGDQHQLPNGLVVRAFQTHHRVQSQGYIVFKQDRVRDAEGRADAKSPAVLRPIFAYTGDTTMEVFLAPPEGLLDVEVLVTEATYICDKQSVAKCRERGHIHLDEIIAQSHLFSRVGKLVLTHLSDRYDWNFVQRTLTRKLPANLRDKVHVCMAAKTFSEQA